MSTFRNLTAWQKAMLLVDETYAAVRRFPESEVYALSRQMRSAAVSIPSNIAEGRGRHTTSDYRHFLYQARGSTHELDTQIEIAVRQEFLRPEESQRLSERVGEVGKLLNTLINSTFPST